MNPCMIAIPPNERVSAPAAVGNIKVYVSTGGYASASKDKFTEVVMHTYIKAKDAQNRKRKKNLWFFNPTQFPTHGQ